MDQLLVEDLWKFYIWQSKVWVPTVEPSQLFPNLLTMAPEDEAALPAAWTADSLFMKRQRGFISTQVHRAIGASLTYLNYAVFDSVAAWRDAFRTPEFREKAKAHPASVVARPHLFTKVAVPDLCMA